MRILKLLVAIFIFSAFFSGTDSVPYTNVTTITEVSAYISIAPSENFTQINFGMLDPDTTDNNATNNSNLDVCSNGCVYPGNTSFNISVSSDTNVNVDFCVWANDSLRSGTNTIYLVGQNYTYNVTQVLVEDASAPLNNSLSPELSTSKMKTVASNNVPPGGRVHYRFWLKVPEAQPAGLYTNNVTFEAVTSGDPC